MLNKKKSEARRRHGSKQPQTIQKPTKKPMYDFDEENPGQHSGTVPRQRNRSHQQASDEDDDLVAEREWKEIQKKLDKEYQKKLKEVNDEAMKKLQTYQEEHKELMRRTQYLYNVKKRAKSRVDSRASQGSRNRPASRGSHISGGGFSNLSFLSSNKDGKNDRNRFFSPKAIKNAQIEVPQQTEEKRTETQMIKLFYKEYCQVVKKNFLPDN